MRNVLASEGTRFLGVAIMEFLEKFWRGVLEFGVRKPQVVLGFWGDLVGYRVGF